MSDARKAELLTSVEIVGKPKAKATLTRRETASRMLRLAVRRSDIKLAVIGDHGQVSRQIDDKENLSYHHMFATWPPEVLRELIALWAVELGGKVEKTIRMRESA